ncbi:hypothetical protein, partial [Wenzhouxiangella sp. XN79A]|uniref:hypothetical protein n=1 Tax=Wenzhouxiangella sp. XN79A TaxID=2724193 RepID=UPI001981DD75
MLAKAGTDHPSPASGLQQAFDPAPALIFLLEGACSRTVGATLRPQAASNRPPIRRQRFASAAIHRCRPKAMLVGASLLAKAGTDHPSPASGLQQTFDPAPALRFSGNPPLPTEGDA